MDIIIVSTEKFLVNTEGEKGMIANEIVCISTTETQDVGTFHGGVNENIPVYSFMKKEDWDKFSKTFPIVLLESQMDLMELYNKVFNVHEDQFESTEDFVFSHGYWPIN